jgi:glycosyltransferase involved in cell wall biosynthesis
MSRPPILHVIPFLWSGAGGVVTSLCEEQRRHGPVTIVTTGHAGDLADWPSYKARLRRAGVAHRTINFFHRSDGQFWLSVVELEALIREMQPAVIHAHAGVPACGVAVARAAVRRKVRVIGQMYSWGPYRPEWMNHQDAWGLGQADKVVCSANAYLSILTQYGVPTRKLVYLPWGLPLERLPYRGEAAPLRHQRSTPSKPSLDVEGPVIGFVGRIEPRKSQMKLIEALAHVRRRLPGARLELIGPVADSAYATAMRVAIDRLGLSTSVRLRGEVRDVALHLRGWDLFVSLSSDEGQGLAVLEAMAVGVPVLARPVAGIADFLRHERTGFAVEHRAVKRVADAIVHALVSPARGVVTRNARRLVERRYAWNATREAFRRLYWT